MEELEGKLKGFEAPVPEISDIGDERVTVSDVWRSRCETGRRQN